MQKQNSSGYSSLTSSFLSAMDSRDTQTLTEKGAKAFTAAGLVDYKRPDNSGIGIDGELVAMWNKMIQGLQRHQVKLFVRNISKFFSLFISKFFS